MKVIICFKKILVVSAGLIVSTIQECRPWVCQILADQLTLFQPGGKDYANLITTGTPAFLDLPTALNIELFSAAHIYARFRNWSIKKCLYEHRNSVHTFEPFIGSHCKSNIIFQPMLKKVSFIFWQLFALQKQIASFNKFFEC